MIYIFGAHSRARTLAAYLKYLQPDCDIRAFLVDNEEENPETADGIEVIRPDRKDHSDGSGSYGGLVPADDDVVYIATRGIYHNEISKRLAGIGFKKIIPVTPEFDTEIRTKYLEKYYKEQGKAFVKIDDLKAKGFVDSHNYSDHGSRAVVYVARTALDEAPGCGYDLPEYATFIQAGAALTDKRISDADGGTGAVCDNSGDNISGKNRQFCELTGLYWIWKNAKEEYVGLEHYRRHFILPEDWLQRMTDNDVDVILPIPLYVAPSVEGNYKERHIPADWKYVMEYLKKNQPDYYKFGSEFFKGNLYSPCNMFIMRKAILDEYCSWVFPILFAVADHVGQHSDPYQNRFPGFISERLMTMYFAKNEVAIKRIYADKNFLN